MLDVAGHDTPHVLIVGAGPIGMVMGCELLSMGVDVRIISKERRRYSPHSRATIVWPRILELLDRTGISEPLVDESHYFDQMNYYSRKLKIGSVRFDALEGVQYPFAITSPQWKIEKIIEKRLIDLGGSIDYGYQLVGLEQDREKVSVTIKDSDGELADWQYRWVVGADGIKSTVRELLGLKFHGTSLRTRLAITDAEIEGEMTSSEAGYYFAKGSNMVIAPIGDGVFRIGSTIGSESVGEQPGKEFFERRLAKHVPGSRRLGRMKFSAVFEANIRSAERYKQGRVFLCGDAAHVMSPSGAQGMNTGLQDVFNLSWKLCGVAKGSLKESILDTYDSERRHSVSQVSEFSTLLAHVGLYSSNAAMLLRDCAYMVGTSTGAFQRYFAPKLAQLDVTYGGSRKYRSLTQGARVPLQWRTVNGMPVLDREKYTLILWPGRSYRYADWASFIKEIGPKLQHMKQLDTAGRPIGASLRNILPKNPAAIICRPDGHLHLCLDIKEDDLNAAGTFVRKLKGSL